MAPDRAYPLDALEKTGVIHDPAEGKPRIVLWYAPTRTAAAFHQPGGIQGDAGWVFSMDPKSSDAPFTDARTVLSAALALTEEEA